MSTQERPRDERKKSKEDPIDDWLDSFSSKTKEAKPAAAKQPSTQTVKESVEQVTPQVEDKVNEETSLDNLIQQFTKQLPPWIQKPWMYVKPTHEGHYKNWIDSWKKLILKYCEVLTEHVINIYDLHEIHPFTNINSGKDISPDELKDIISAMVEQDLAKWLDDESIRARIYFKTDEEWAGIIYQYTLDYGYATDMLTLYELRKLDQPWTRLPDQELQLVLDILVEQNKAEWIGSERDTIQFKL